MNKQSLLSVLSDTAIVNEIKGSTTTLEAVGSATNEQALEVLLGSNGAGVSAGAYTVAEAIILLQGRPALLIQGGKWEDPKSQEIANRLAPGAVKLKEAIPKVGRVEILDFSTDYVGTGWMIDDGVLITNRHVANLFGEKRGGAFSFRTDPSGIKYKARVDFLHEHERTDISQAEIAEIIYIEDDDALRPDLALVRLKRGSGSLPAPIDLEEIQLGFNPSQPVDLAVIGYPAQDPRNDAFAMRDIFKNIYNVKRLSPGRLTGVRQDGKLLEHDCTTLGGNSGSVVINVATGKACGLHFSGSYRVSNYAVTSSWLKSRLAEITPGRISVPANFAAPGNQERTAPDLTGSGGYVPEFLGSGTLRVGLPEIPNHLPLAPVKNRNDGELKYSHFSIFMRADRRLPFYTACNIDGGLLFNFPRGTDHWFKEDRLENPNHQIGEELYANNTLDRGHLVRRLDPAWGQTREDGKTAEEQTFFFTNCSPQHKRLNQQTWLSLEDHVLSNAATHKLKVSVFAGPVMNDSDRTYRDVKIPEEFWKVLVILNAATGRLSATGYILSQANYLGDLEFLFGEFKTYQVPISRIEEKTQLSFGLSEFDPLAQTEAQPLREIRSAADLIV